ncbi:hypothetical protein DXV76_10135 [Rhodobacteraceae bacterium CCMM004]|nr:hypothetical protein DXV76_10135 [Rhodobacteraceae bacterium CCMM004]
MLAAGLAAGAAWGKEADGSGGGAGLADLFDALRQAEGPAAEQIAEKIREEWARSGSPAMDYLLERGYKALEDFDPALAVEHFTAVIDHAPEFAEGWHGRATAYFRQARYGESLDDIRMALALNPRHFGALTGLAVMLEELGYDQPALRAWRAVAEIYPAQEGAAEAIARLSNRVEGTAL